MTPDDIPFATDQPTEDLTADVIVIGGGPVGENVAQYAIEDTDLTAILVEHELVGGECSYWACMPSKALLRPVAVADTASHLGGVSSPTVQTDDLLARRDEFVSHYDDSSQIEWTDSAGIQVMRGRARLSGEREVLIEPEADGSGPGDAEAGDAGSESDPARAGGSAADASGSARAGGSVRLRARRAVVLATGSEAIVPGSLSPARPWTSRDVTAVREIPGRLLIVGGGVVAVEAATWMAALGSTVTMLVRGDSLLTGYEPFAGQHVREALEAAGVTIRFGTEAVSASRPEAAGGGDVGRLHGGPVTVTVRSADGQQELSGDELLAATGRKPHLDDVGLENVGLTADDVTGGSLPTWLHAVGDASGETPLTHWGKYRARVIGERIRAGALGQEPQPTVDTAVSPQVVFTDPQVAAVGMTESQAREAGHRVEVSQLPFGSAAGTALLRDDVTGTAQIVVDADTHRLLGVTFVGPEAGEQIHAGTVAIVGQVPVDVLRHAVPTFPAASELWLNLLEQLPRQLRRPA